LPKQLEVAIPGSPPPYYSPMSWNEIRSLEHDGFEFGAHTMQHPILPRMALATDIQREVLESKQLLEQRLEHPVLHFCYPNGDFDARSEAAVRQAGFQTAVTCLRGAVDSGSDWLRLNRMLVDPVTPHLYFAESLAGLRKR
jgi:peptidoglycan/xylan/chitin deacetylase (PgdA/CDA1 family)